jgi:hypothetical protein
MNKKFETKFRQICWRLQIDADSWLDSHLYREFAEEFYDLGLKDGKEIEDK